MEKTATAKIISNKEKPRCLARLSKKPLPKKLTFTFVIHRAQNDHHHLTIERAVVTTKTKRRFIRTAGKNKTAPPAGILLKKNLILVIRLLILLEIDINRNDFIIGRISAIKFIAFKKYETIRNRRSAAQCRT